ncbi:MAG: glycosyltransferase [Vicinamibacterales bacterium]
MTAASAPSGVDRLAGLRVALVHDWLTGMRGGERALEAFCDLFPHAHLHTMVHVSGSVSAQIERRPIHDSALRYVPGLGRVYRHLLPAFPTIVEQFDLDEYDLVVSTSHCAVKSVVVPGRTLHVSYCFTPMRYAWDQFDAYFGAERLGVFSRFARLALGGLADWDRRTSRRPNRYVAISQYVARRIAMYYNRSAVVVYPPVDTQFYCPADRKVDDYFLIVSALVPYKRVDLAIEACKRLGARLRVIGQGPELARLQRLAGPETSFLGHCPDDEVREQYRAARAVLLPGEEDFGMVPVEAQACGRPVVALGRGGALETVVPGQTGVLVEEPTAEAFADGLRRASELAVDAAVIRAHAEQFSKLAFLERMSGLLADSWLAFREARA